MTTAQEHLSLDVLLQDWLGEVDAAGREAIDSHLMACDDCGQLFDEVVALGSGVRDALLGGRLFTAASPAFVDRLVERGVHVREYRVPKDGSVNCTVAPGDEVLVSRLQAPLAGIQRLDVAQESSLAPGEVRHLEDIPFNPDAGEVVYLSSLAMVRALPAHTVRLTLIAAQDGGPREIGRYVFHHSPWPG